MENVLVKVITKLKEQTNAIQLSYICLKPFTAAQITNKLSMHTFGGESVRLLNRLKCFLILIHLPQMHQKLFFFQKVNTINYT